MIRKETDMNTIKELLKAFLHMPVEKTEFFPMIVQHPIFESGYSNVNGKIVDITTSDGLKEAIDELTEKIDSISNPMTCMSVLRKSYYLTFLKFAKKVYHYPILVYCLENAGRKRRIRTMM